MPSPHRPGASDADPAAELRKRLRGLAPAYMVRMREVIRLHAGGDRRGFAMALLPLASEAPEHAEVLYWLGVLHSGSNAWADAVTVLRRASALRDDDFRIWLRLATALEQSHDIEGAGQAFDHALHCAGTAADCLELSMECDRHGLYETALAAADAALQRDPQSARALLQRTRCHKALGHAEAAAADCRRMIALGRETARAWFALLDLKTVRLAEAERTQLEAAARKPGLPAHERELLDFALGHALEDAGDHPGALAAFQRANASVRATTPWNAEAFASHVEAVRSTFASGNTAQATPQGREVIFLVGLPRSGSTLTEQVLAAHPQVEGASELPYLAQVLEAESRRRGRPFPTWVGDASTEDWTRLGRQYLALSARWRRGAPIATDKLPDNWLHVGAIRAMLPEARIIDCRRDPLETCWSCYKQRFGPGLAAFSYAFDSLGQYLHACEALGDFWVRQHPEHVRVQSYEALAADPEAQIRALLDFCRLPFDPACLDFQASTRAIRTPSALQVRQPLRRASVRAAGYGALLDPLRQALQAFGRGRQD